MNPNTRFVLEVIKAGNQDSTSWPASAKFNFGIRVQCLRHPGITVIPVECGSEVAAVEHERTALLALPHSKAPRLRFYRLEGNDESLPAFTF